MRALIPLLLLCGLSWAVQAQDDAYKKLVRQETRQLVRLYQLDKAQESAVYALQERYYQQLVEIAPLKAENKQRAYLYKLRSIRTGLQFGIQQVLRPEQLPAFEAERQRREQAYRDRLASLKAEGAPKESLELAKIAIE